MINEDDYFNFLDEMIQIKCLNKTYKTLWHIKKKILFPSVESNTQIRFLLNEIYKHKNISAYNNFIICILQFTILIFIVLTLDSCILYLDSWFLILIS